MRTITARDGRVLTLSDEEYVVTSGPNPSYSMNHLRPGDRVRLISGIDGSSVPGHHFSPGWVTVCPSDASGAMWLGIVKRDLEPVTTIVFKAVYRHSRKFFSFTRKYLYSGNDCGRILRRYQIGHVTRPKIGKLFAFDNELTAVNYLQGRTDVWAVLKCEATGVSKPTFDCLPFGDYVTNFRDFWKNRLNPHFTRNAVPGGTVLCDSIKPLGRVWPKKGTSVKSSS